MIIFVSFFLVSIYDNQYNDDDDIEVNWNDDEMKMVRFEPFDDDQFVIFVSVRPR